MAPDTDFNLVQAAEALLRDAQTLAATTNSGPKDGSEVELRRRITQTAKQIAFETAPPMDVVKADWVVLADVAAWNLFIDWKAFDLIPLDGYISVSDLARALNAQESLVARISAILVATSKLRPGPHPHTLRHSRISPLYISTHPASALAAVAVGNGMKPYAHWPEYFRTYGRREPVPVAVAPDQRPAAITIPAIGGNGGATTTAAAGAHRNAAGHSAAARQPIRVQIPAHAHAHAPGDVHPRSPIPTPASARYAARVITPFSFAWGHPALAPWEVKALFPAYAETFARSMKAREIVGGDVPLAGPGAAYDFGWVGAEAEAVWKRAQGQARGRKGRGMPGEAAVAVVDVGGGLGQLLRDLLRQVKGVRPEQCVLQDRWEVVEQARRVWVENGWEKEACRGEGSGKIVMMEHDFNVPQKVQGASVYLLRRVLLDYSDAEAIGILRHLADALPVDNPNARVIIIEEQLLDPPAPQNRIVDLVMLNLGGKLRNKAMFGEIAAAAGLKMVGYHAREGDAICVVECAKA